MNMTREQWRDLQRRITKGGLPVFKEIMHEIYESALNDAYKNMVVQGMTDVKRVVTETLEEVMNTELGIGKKRFEKFSEAFSDAVDKKVGGIQTEVVVEDNKEKSLIEEDINSMVILLCVRQYVEELLTNKEGRFSTNEVKFNLSNIRKGINNLEELMVVTMHSNQIKELFAAASNKELYLTDKVTKPEPK